jgi:hypothetical protein
VARAAAGEPETLARQELVLGNPSEGVELTIVGVQPGIPGYTSGGDVEVVVRAWAGGFAGEVDTWIQPNTWAQFCRELTQFERTRKGEAVLTSVGGEMSLRFCALDRLGHIGVEGTLRRYRTVALGTQVLELKFGSIEVDPTMLPGLLAELMASPHLTDR